jgi:hypothetical protein
VPKANDTWKVLEHAPVERLADNLLRVEGAIPGMPLRRVMTVARRSDGGTIIHNAVPLDEASMKIIEALGDPAYLVVPNGYHRLDAKVFKDRYPKIRVVAPRGARKKVEEVVPVDLTIEEVPRDATVNVEPLDGVGEAEGVMTVQSADGATLVFNDVLFNMPHVSGVSGFVLKHVAQSTGGPRVSRLARWFLLKDKEAVRAELLRLAKTPNLRRVIVSHHQMIQGPEAGATLERVAATL